MTINKLKMTICPTNVVVDDGSWSTQIRACLALLKPAFWKSTNLKYCLGKKKQIKKLFIYFGVLKRYI